MPKRPDKEKAFPVGLFIIIATLMVVGGLIFLRGLASKPAYSFTIRYLNPDPVSSGVAVYYRGVQVGRVTKVSLAPDAKSTLLKVGITKKGLKLPDNVESHIRLEGITGMRFIQIQPPKPGEESKSYIADGELIEGVSSVTLDKLREQLANIAENRVLENIMVSAEKTLANLEKTTSVLDDALRQAKSFIKDSQSSLKNVENTSDEIAAAASEVKNLARNANDTMPQVASAVNQFGENTKGLDDAFQNVGQAAHRVDTSLGYMESELKRTDLIRNWAQAGSELRGGIKSTTSSIDQLSGQLGQASTSFGTTMENVNRQIGGSGQQQRINITPPTDSPSGNAPARNDASNHSSSYFPPEMDELNRAMKALHSSNERLQAHVAEALAKGSPAKTRSDLEGLQRFSESINQTPESITPNMLVGLSVAEAQKEFGQLQRFGELVANGSSRYRPVIASYGDLPASLRDTMVQDLADLSASGIRVAAQVEQVQPRLSGIIAKLPPPKPGIMEVATGTMLQINRTAKRFDCVGSQLNHILSQRFLGFRLFFGKPGEGFECQPNGQTAGKH